MFLRPDPAMDGLNHYAYSSCNLVMYSDPTGMATAWMQNLGWGLIAAGIVCAVLAAIFGKIAPLSIALGCIGGSLIATGIGFLTAGNLSDVNIVIQGQVPVGENSASKEAYNNAVNEINSRVNHESNWSYDQYCFNQWIKQVASDKAYEQAILNGIINYALGYTKEYKDQFNDIGGGGEYYCNFATYMTHYGMAYFNKYNKFPSASKLGIIRDNAVNNGSIEENGYINNYATLTTTVNQIMGTNFKHERITNEGDYPSDFGSWSNGNKYYYAYVRFYNGKFANEDPIKHFSPYLGNNTVWDVYSHYARPRSPVKNISGLTIYEYGYDVWTIPLF